MKNLDAVFTVLALYGVRNSPTAVSWFYNASIDWMRGLGITPDTLVIEGKGFSGRAAGFAIIDRKVKKSGFEHLEGFEITAMVPGGKDPNRDYMLKACWASDGSYAFVGGDTSVIGDSLETYRDITVQSAREMRPGYGIGYSRPRKLGPFYFAVGIGQGSGLSGAAYAQALRITRWSLIGIEEKVWKRGYIRDVYQWNILNENQLLFPVGKLTLETWIKANPRRGKLEAMSCGLSHWAVDPRNLSVVDRELSEHSYVAGWQTY